MNRLSLNERVRVLNALVERNSIRGTSRMTGVAKGTILKLLADVGDACDRAQRLWFGLRRYRAGLQLHASNQSGLAGSCLDVARSGELARGLAE